MHIRWGQPVVAAAAEEAGAADAANFLGGGNHSSTMDVNPSEAAECGLADRAHH
jgi:hypothetical protein